MAPGNNHGASPEQGSKMPDLPNRNFQRQTVPTEAEEDLPPTYDESSPRGTGTTQSPRDLITASTPSSDRIHAHTAAIPLVPPMSTHRDLEPEGYLMTDPMRWELKEQRGDWDKYDHVPGRLCSDTGGVLCSSRGGVMFSDREGFFCSDRNGRYCSDTGGLLCSDFGGSFCSSGSNEQVVKKRKEQQQQKTMSDGRRY